MTIAATLACMVACEDAAVVEGAPSQDANQPADSSAVVDSQVSSDATVAANPDANSTAVDGLAPLDTADSGEPADGTAPDGTASDGAAASDTQVSVDAGKDTPKPTCDPANCDDKNPCTTDGCTAAASCSHSANFAPCSDNNACTEGEQCQGGLCATGKLKACADGNSCTDDGCDPVAGCVFANGDSPCDDTNACTTGEKCKAGACLPTAATNCDDGNPCTNDDCKPQTGCSNTANTVGCSDGNVCTTLDLCTAASCVGSKPLTCNDNNPCTEDLCQPDLGCTTANNSAPCSDGSACTLGDTCKKGACSGGALLDCDDEKPCTVDSCNIKGQCQNVNSPAACDDANACTVGETCATGNCGGGTAIGCTDSNLCTTDSCEPAKGCVFTANTSDCSDSNVCTLGDKCAGGTCASGSLISCSDSNPCTDDSCDGKTGCVYAANTAACDDFNKCSQGDTCNGGTCLPGGPLTCNDGNPCTDDPCKTGSGCLFVPNFAACSDGSVCSLGDGCQAGVCLPGVPTNCDDGNQCSVDACEPKSGCTNLANTLPCNDGSVCTLGDTCKAKACLAGKPIVCNDGNLCTDDSCNAAVGCSTTFNAVGCNDSNACTSSDTCALGGCKGKTVNCDDGTVCTLDACDATKGCIAVAVPGLCDDGNACTSGDICGAGVCAGASIACNDGKPCTTDSCEPKTGCKAATAPDGTSCGNGQCQSGVCVVGTFDSPATSCKQILTYMPSTVSGLYWLDPDGAGGIVAKFQASCDMVGDGGGWTLVLKVDGKSAVFAAAATNVWGSTGLVNGDKVNFDKQEARLMGYATLALTELRVGMTTDTTAPKTIVMPMVGTSLGALIVKGSLVQTAIGRNKWKGLLANSSLQTQCNQEGLNTATCRIGIAGNNENECASPDSWLGIGCVNGYSCGNFANASWAPDNGGAAIVAFGYVWVR